MKPFSLLQALQNPPAAKPVPEVKPVPEAVAAPVEPVHVDEPAKTAYRIYVIETARGSLQVGVPLDNVEQFDSYFSANPSAITKIEEHLEQFEAVVI